MARDRSARSGSKSETSSGTAVTPLSCKRCGGAFGADAHACPWCGGGIALEDRRVAGPCSGCGARFGAVDRFCAGCGRARPVDEIGGSLGVPCPRCTQALRARRLEGFDAVECAGCGGLWLAAGELERWLDASATRGVAALDTRTPREREREVAPSYRACPVCEDRMPRRNYGASSGIVVDVCGRHGVWLDPGELEAIAAFVARGGLERERERRARRDREREERARSDPAPAIPSAWSEKEVRGASAPTFVALLLETLCELLVRER